MEKFVSKDNLRYNIRKTKDYVNDGLENKQNILVSGENIKTINNQSILGSGNIIVEGVTDYEDLNNLPQINDTTLMGNKTSSELGLQSILTFDSTPIENSDNPVTSDGIYSSLNNIKCINGIIDPTTSTVGGIGQFYLNTLNQKLFQCVSIETGDNANLYIWNKVGENIPEPTVNDDGKIITVDNNSYILSTLKTINGNNIVGNGNIAIKTYQPFPSSWSSAVSGTTSNFCSIVNADSSTIEGMAYLGEVRWSDLPSSLVNAEVVVEIMSGSGTSGKVIHLTLTSGNRNPYRWEYTYWNNGSNVSGWIGFQPQLNAGSNITISNNTISATNTTYTAGTGLDLTGTEFSVDESVVALKSDLPQGEVDITLNGTATLTTEVLNNIVVDTKTYTLTSARQTPASGGTTLSLVNTGDMYTWNNKQDTLTAGNNITIQNNVISATVQSVLNGVAYREI